MAIGALVAIGDVLLAKCSSSVEHPTRALGFDQGQLVATAMSWLTVPVVVGALLSVVGLAYGLASYAHRGRTARQLRP